MSKHLTSYGGKPVTTPTSTETEQSCFVRVHVPPEHLVDYIYGGKHFVVDQLMVTWSINSNRDRFLEVGMHGIIRRSDGTPGVRHLHNHAQLRWPAGQKPSVPTDTKMPDWVIETVLINATGPSLVPTEFGDAVEAMHQYLNNIDTTTPTKEA